MLRKGITGQKVNVQERHRALIALRGPLGGSSDWALGGSADREVADSAAAPEMDTRGRRNLVTQRVDMSEDGDEKDEYASRRWSQQKTSR